RLRRAVAADPAHARAARELPAPHGPLLGRHLQRGRAGGALAAGRSAGQRPLARGHGLRGNRTLVCADRDRRGPRAGPAREATEGAALPRRAVLLAGVRALPALAREASPPASLAGAGRARAGRPGPAPESA